MGAYGAPEPSHDVDLVVAESDVAAPSETLRSTGFDIESPPEDWLFKARCATRSWTYCTGSTAYGVDATTLRRAEQRDVLAIAMPVLPPTMVLVQNCAPATNITSISRSRRPPSGRFAMGPYQVTDRRQRLRDGVLGPCRMARFHSVIQWLRNFATSLSLVSPEYPDMPSSLARFFNSGTVQSLYEPDLPPSRETDYLPRLAAAFEIRAAFSFESPCLRRSWYSFSFLIDEFGMSAPLRVLSNC